jgi:carbamoyltransferase
VADEARRSGISDEDVLASVHQFMEELLVARVAAEVASHPDGRSRNLCFSGGCALNIKWNSALRALPLFDEVWVHRSPTTPGQRSVKRSGCDGDSIP